MARAGQDRISRFVYFGHGAPGLISPRMESAISISYACNSATRPETGGDSFTAAWRSYFGSLMYGVNGENTRWIPEDPNRH